MTVEFKRIRSTSLWRLVIVALSLLAWVAGVSVLVSRLSPLHELVNASPIEDDEKVKSSLEAVAKLNRQIIEANRILYHAEDVSKKLEERSNEILTIIDGGRLESAFGWLYFILNNSDVNEISLPGDSYRLMNIVDVRLVSHDGGTSLPFTKMLTKMSIEVCSPNLSVDPVDNSEEEKINNSLDPISFLYLGLKADKQKYDLLCDSVSEFPISLSPQDFQKYKEIRGKRLASFIVNNDILDRKSVVDMEFSIREQFEMRNSDLLVLVEKYIARQSSVFKGTLTSITKLRNEFVERRRVLESRLNSSSALFAVATFRTTLITAIVVSIGFVLLRSFSAEIYHARRLSEMEVAHMLAESLDLEKLSHVPELAKAISGRHTKAAASVPEDVINAAGKLGEAVSRFNSKSSGKV